MNAQGVQDRRREARPGYIRETSDDLTPREVQVIRLVSDGLTNKEIGASLRINPETAASHVRNILRKLDARNRPHAVSLWLTERIGQTAEEPSLPWPPLPAPQPRVPAEWEMLTCACGEFVRGSDAESARRAASE